MKKTLFVLVLTFTTFVARNALAQSKQIVNGTAFYPNQVCAKSNNGLYRLVYQGDGNLVLYNSANVGLWASGPLQNGNLSSCDFAYFNIVIHRNGGSVLWSYSPPQHDATTAGSWVLQDDGNFVFYAVLNYAGGSYSVSTGTQGGKKSGNFGTFK
ncbi:hypothetical protein [Mucilaginibacter jinjuensis]|uniref:Bulb-type lectin domain-containing protein n=1 Tax=Mucilaginibacter jinjuensis TaxID=1176721 RepID=A0ABY7TB89_9SPHI|nr:hypothetical protein [Mucilaginibacter jinjuensis]WCT13578.1 hypothetical protein PQO05_06460 [Mucilaginibacter jinjuensis]